jgi:hypothetical protein
MAHVFDEPHMIKTTLDRNAARPNKIVRGKLYIPMSQTEVFIDDGNKQMIRFTYQDLGYDWREPMGVYGTWGDSHTLVLKQFAKMLKIKGYSKMKEAELAPIVWSRIILDPTG